MVNKIMYCPGISKPLGWYQSSVSEPVQGCKETKSLINLIAGGERSYSDNIHHGPANHRPTDS